MKYIFIALIIFSCKPEKKHYPELEAKAFPDSSLFSIAHMVESGGGFREYTTQWTTEKGEMMYLVHFIRRIGSDTLIMVKPNWPDMWKGVKHFKVGDDIFTKGKAAIIINRSYDTVGTVIIGGN